MNKKNYKKPGITLWILRKIIPEYDFTSVFGDFEELYKSQLKENGSFRSLLWMWIQIFKFIPVFIKKSTYWSFTMFKNYLKIALRNLARYKGYSLINITGLAVGIACSVLVILYVFHELSYDNYHEKADRTYRIAIDAWIGDIKADQFFTPAILSKTLLEEYPEVETATKISSLFNNIITCDEKSFKERNIFAADERFFDVFDFPLIKGDRKTVLNDPGNVILSETAAEIYFDDEDPIGKSIVLGYYGEDIALTVRGVAEDVPENSHFHFDFLISLSTFPWSRETNWFMNDYATYIVLQENYSVEEFEKKLKDICDNRAFEGRSNKWRWFLQPLPAIHLHSDLQFEFEPTGGAVYVYMFTVISILILVIACINFINLTTARSANRAKEVGIRKVVGSRRIQLIKQFIGESVILSFLALILAVILIKITLPFFRDFTGRNIEFSLFSDWNFLFALIVTALMIGLIAGIYPALYLSGFKPLSVLQGAALKRAGKRFSFFRDGMVVFQFAVSVFLIISTIVVYNQMEYVQNKKLGFEKEQIVVVHNASLLGSDIDSFKEKLLQYSRISNVSYSHTLPGKHFNNLGVSMQGVGNTTLNLGWCDHDFLETLGMEMLDGRFFSKEFVSDTAAIVLNEQALSDFNLQDPLGKSLMISYGRSEYKIVGVIKDFHFQSLHQPVNRAGLILLDKHKNFYKKAEFVSVKINTEDIPGTLSYLERSWDSFSPTLPVEYSFFDDDYSSLYKSEMQTGNIAAVFSILAVLISCLGLFGMIAYIAEQRTKEIGIRKTLGASVNSITQLLSKEYILLVIMANVISWPIGYIFMNRWLEQFAYHIDLSVAIFLLSGVLSVLIAILTVGYQTVKAAVANPVDSLKYE
ncbi:MAG: FtsX-like permease family protein [bacterium]|nr:FtsX-like permease family protein [bacterium]